MKLFQEGKPVYRANFHLHTTRSDGRRTPEEAAALYRRMGYDILAITDHRKVTEIAAPEGLLLVLGIELDFMLKTQAVHLLGIGVDGRIIHRWQPMGTPQQAIDDIRACGGRVILAHPAWSLNTPETMAAMTGLSAVEVWNSVSAPPLNADRADSSSLLDVTAALGRPLPFVANDDTHVYGAEVALGWTMIQADALTVPAVLDALDRGSFYATQGPAIHQLEIEDGQMRVTCSPADRIIFYSNQVWVEGRTRMGKGMTESVYDIQPGDHFVRVQVTDAEGKHAWSSAYAV